MLKVFNREIFIFQSVAPGMQAAERAAAALREAIAATSEGRGLRAVLRALAVSLAATATAVGLP